MREIVRLAPWLAAAVLFAVVLGWLGSLVLLRFAGVDDTTSFFAMAIGGASEMAAQAMRHGGRVDRVAAAHSLRIMLVVLIVPLLFTWLGVQGLDPYEPAARLFDPVGFAVLTAVTLGAAVAMERLGSPNSWMIGPLLAAAVVTSMGLTWSSLPVPVVRCRAAAEIGIGLGTRFTPEFFESAPRFLGAVAAITLVYLVVAAVFGWLLSAGSGLHWSTAIVATTPGGIGEMALTLLSQAPKSSLTVFTVSEKCLEEGCVRLESLPPPAFMPWIITLTV